MAEELPVDLLEGFPVEREGVQPVVLPVAEGVLLHQPLLNEADLPHEGEAGVVVLVDVGVDLTQREMPEQVAVGQQPCLGSAAVEAVVRIHHQRAEGETVGGVVLRGVEEADGLLRLLHGGDDEQHMVVAVQIAVEMLAEAVGGGDSAACPVAAGLQVPVHPRQKGHVPVVHPAQDAAPASDLITHAGSPLRLLQAVHAAF